MLTPEELKQVLPAESSAYPSPIPAQNVSSDEYMPCPQTEKHREFETRVKEYGGELARKHGWQRVLLVTSRFHVTRARMLFDRCTDADVDAVGVDYPWTSMPAAVVGEWVKLGLSETVSRGC